MEHDKETLWLIVGPAQGEHGPEIALPLRGGLFTIGRSTACSLVLRDSKVSRHHCTISVEHGEVYVRDENSSYGIIINGERSGGKKLENGDILAVGPVLLRLHKGNPATVPRRAATLYSTGESGAAARGTTNRKKPGLVSTGQLRPLLERMKKLDGVEAVLKCLLGGLVEIFRADRGFVLLVPHVARLRDSSAFQPAAAKGAEPGKTGGSPAQAGKGDATAERLIPVAAHCLGDTRSFLDFSETVYRYVLENGKTLFIPDTASDGWYLAHCGRSLNDQSVSIACSPILSGDETIGVIYLDAQPDQTILSDTHLPLLETITHFAAEIIESHSTRKSLAQARKTIRAMNYLSREKERIIFGPSEASRKLRNIIKATAGQDISVLITGETGTGKELVARAIHAASKRREGAFVPVNCAALPCDTIEAELFGAERGAYTGAVESRRGRFELAHGGTLFLDEVGELPAAVQVKLLRILQERSITRLGSTKALPLDFRLICATNADLDASIRSGEFRRDFFYRINVFGIHLLALRERREDIPALASFFVEHFSEKLGGRRKRLGRAAMKEILAYDWPGNVRELKNTIERAFVIESSDTISPASLSLGRTDSATPSTGEGDFWRFLPNDYAQALGIFEKTFLVKSLERNNNNISAVAREYGKTRNAIYRRMKRLGIATKAESGNSD